MTTFELEAIGGPWGKRLAGRRAIVGELDWGTLAGSVSPSEAERARVVWTQSAFSEYASAAAFAEIASALLAAGAPIDLVAASGDFVADEIIHAELSARLANALGGAVPLEVDLAKLVRPPTGSTPLLRAAELVVRTSCVGEALTVPVLKAARAAADSAVIAAVIARITRDESAHAELGGWFLDWASPRFAASDRAHLGRVATSALASLAPLMEVECSSPPGLGVLDCRSFDAALFAAVDERVVRPLAARGIEVASPLVRPIP
ncbi:MAG: hypothetical protein JST00_21335 [Deltaproteobacteria bacterium]|nr:hypothetical protein [Deltaproteobacteria bacterium]